MPRKRTDDFPIGGMDDLIDMPPPEDVVDGDSKTVQREAERLLHTLRERVLKIAAEKARRQQEAHRVYIPLPNALRFHQSLASERLLLGSNRSGKSQAAAAELAWTVLNCHPHRPNKNQPKIIYCVGASTNHIQNVMWPKLGMDNSFKIIKDEHTQLWRPVYPDNPYDAAYEEKWKPAPPFLPPRAIKGISWYFKGSGCPRMVRLRDGTRIQFFTANGKPQQGSQIDGVWFDEEIQNETWIPEMQARCVDRKGWMFWSCTPENATRPLLMMHQNATAPLGDRGSIEEFRLLISENPHLSEASKAAFRTKLLTQRAIDTKWFGKFVLEDLMVYPEFGDKTMIDPVTIPDDWCRFMVVDPGVQVCGTLFAAVPPKGSEHAGLVHIYDELYINRCSAAIWAEEAVKKMGDLKDGGFEAYYMDDRMGRQSDVGSGRTVSVQYSEELKARGAWSQRTQNGFIPGSDNTSAREGALRRWLEERIDTGTPTLRVHRGRCRNLEWEMGQQFFQKDNERVVGAKSSVSDRRIRIHNHLVDCLEYLADANPQWRPKRVAHRVEAGMKNIIKRLMEKKKESKEYRF